MAKRRDYIPSRLDEFVSYQATLCALVVKHAKEWGVPSAEVKALQEGRTGYEAAHKRYADLLNRSRLDMYNHDQLRTEYTRTIRGIVQRYLARNPLLDSTVRCTLGLEFVAVRRKKLKKIHGEVMCLLKALGGTRVRFDCHRPESVGRPKLHSECHAVEVEYMLLDSPHQPALTAFMASGRHTSSRAQFSLKVGVAGQWLHARARWVNTSDPNLSGGWGTVRMVLIY